MYTEHTKQIALLCDHIRKDAQEFLANGYKDRTQARRIEALMQTIIKHATPFCHLFVNPYHLELIRERIRVAEVDETQSKLSQLLQKNIFNSLQCDLRQAKVKSSYSVYEKIIDGRRGRQGGLTHLQKQQRVIEFEKLMETARNDISCWYDLVRGMLIAADPQDFAKADQTLVSLIDHSEWQLDQRSCIGEVNVPSTYVAIHYKLSRGRLQAAEVQLRLAQSHYGPHLLHMTNGYLNKYCSDDVTEIDYTYDRLSSL